jgi:DNA primase
MNSPLIKEGRYYFADRNGQYVNQGSNFIMENPYLITGREPKRVIRAENEHGDEIVFTITAKDFASMQQFKGLIEGKGNFIWFGTAQHLSLVKSKLFNESLTAQELEYLGYIPEFDIYAFCNGVVNGKGHFIPADDDGFVKNKENCYFIPYESKINEDDSSFENFRKFKHNARNDVTFAEWSKAFYQVYGEKGLIAISYIFAAIFRDVVVGYFPFFPHFFLFGIPGSGKSAFSESIQYLFGLPQPPINLEAGSTAVGSFRKLEQISNAVVAFNEYKNSIDPKVIGLLKAAYDNQGRETGVMSNDTRTKTSKIRSALMIAGQDLPTNDAALFSRVVPIEFIKRDSYTDDEKTAFDELGHMQNLGITSVLIEILRHRNYFKEHFIKKHREVVSEIKQHLKSNTNPATERSILNYCILIAAYRLMAEKLDMPCMGNVFEKNITDNMTEYLSLLNASTDISNFWDAFEYLVTKTRLVIDRDFIVRHDDTTNEKQICIRWQNVYPEYRRHLIDQRTVPLGNQTLLQYLKHSREFLKRADVKFMMATYKAYVFNFSMLNLSIETDNL